MTVIKFEDRDGATGDALASALYNKIDRNLAEFDDALGRAILDADEEHFADCASDTYFADEELSDAVGYAVDSLRLARVIKALDAGRPGDPERVLDLIHGRAK
jgi:hypothetical protein